MNARESVDSFGIAEGEDLTEEPAAGEERISLSDPDITLRELKAVEQVLCSPRLSAGPTAAAFERAFANHAGREHAVAVASGTLGMLLALRALGYGAGDEVITTGFAWHQVAHAITLAGARPVFSEIDYWSGCLSPERAEGRIGPRTRAILASNVNGHPAAWRELRTLADRHGLTLLEDSTEAIGSRYLGQPVGSFGDLAVFDFSQPSLLVCGEGGMVVTDDAGLASELRYHRSRGAEARTSVAIGSRVPLQAGMSELSATLGLVQLQRIDELLSRRKAVEQRYLEYLQTFEGIKPPYIAPNVDVAHWMVFLVHLGTRFSRSLRNQIVDDLVTAGIDAAVYCDPLHQQFHYQQLGNQRGDLKLTERIADRALALPFHAHLDDDAVRFIVETAKDSSTNVGAGTAIYL
jgi:dTDP-4-amino-4,6-dideoxygalactose transaminase